MLNYNIKGTQVSVSEELRAYVERALGHAAKFLEADPTTHVDVELEFSQVRDGAKYRAEFTAEASGALYRADCWGTTLHEAIDLAVGELTGELRKNKTKKLHFLRRGALRVKEFVRGFRENI
ncbi:ribosome-associated translation inhibitor RaiA [Candidatus Parcubacteria bacterium]|nr:ribosome-associated translation inhibitor RaiA [Candidatus Parcubacteria bacterium]